MGDRLPLLAVRPGHALRRLERGKVGRSSTRRAVCECGEATAWSATAGSAIVAYRGHAGAIRG